VVAAKVVEAVKEVKEEVKAAAAEEEFLDYVEDDDQVQDHKAEKDTKKGHYVGIHTSSFRDFILKPELLRAVVDCGFEHPSEG